MSEDEMKDLWLSQKMEVNLEAGLLNEIRNTTDTIKKKIRWRDRQEELAAAFGSLCFMLAFYFFEDVFVKIGCVLIILFAVEVVVVLRLNRKQPVSIGLSLKEQLQEELKFFRKQRKLLSTVTYWYITPFLIGITFFTWGINDGWIAFVLHSFFNIFIAAAIFIANKKAVQDQFSPLIERLEKLLGQLEKS